MHVIQLTAENVKRLRAVDITPDPTLQVITGRNAQGKSSVLDALWLALGGGDAKKTTTRPIRDGETRATVTVDLGDLKVTRTWTANDRTTLKVTNADGATYSSPQAVLDKLVGRLTFDPLAFAKLPPKAQRDQLVALTGLDLDALDAERADVFADRTAVGRDLKAAQGHLDSLPVPPSGTPDTEVSAGDIITEIREAEAHNRARANAEAAMIAADDEVAHINQQIAELQQRLAEATQRSKTKGAELRAMPPTVDTSALTMQLEDVEGTNRAVRAARDVAQARDRVEQARAAYDERTERLAQIDAAKAARLAEAKFPVPGLGFDDQGVTFQGVPFSQASSAEQIRVSMAMAMALNPELRVIRIMDGSLLDGESMQVISDMARDRGFQVWVERVEDPSAAAVVIEDGQVVSA